MVGRLFYLGSDRPEQRAEASLATWQSSSQDDRDRAGQPGGVRLRGQDPTILLTLELNVTGDLVLLSYHLYHLASGGYGGNVKNSNFP